MTNSSNSKEEPRAKDEGEEFFRAWAHDGKLVVKLDPGMFKDPSNAGIFLADIARHYARAFVETGRTKTEDEALSKIRTAFDAEWHFPTDEIEGGVVNQ